MKVYRHPFVKETLELHQHILQHPGSYRSVKELIILLANNLFNHLKNGNPTALKIISTYLPEFHEKVTSEIPSAGLDLEDCQLAIAKEYGYANWENALSESDQTFDKDFEAAINLLVNGDLQKLQKLLEEHPEILQQHSPFWHSAGLIHYVASNGVEIWRQCVPDNLLEITSMLLNHGADPQMPNNIYGGSNLINLIETSSHPNKVGIANQLIHLIKTSLQH
jgi:hypothetical protein